MLRFVEISVMKSIFATYKYPSLLLLLAFSWLLLSVFIFQIELQTFRFGDSKSYELAAIDLYQKEILNDHRPLVISAINGFPLLFGFSPTVIYTWSLIVNLACWFVTVLLIFSMAKRYTSERVAFLTAAFFILCVGNMFITFHLLSESIFTFCLLLVLFLIQKHYDTTKIHFLIYTLSLLVLMIMIKPLSLLLVVIVIVFFYKKTNQFFKSKSVIVLFLCSFVLLFQMITLKKEFGNFTVSYIDSFTYYNYLGTHADCLQKKTEFIQGQNDRYVYFGKLVPKQQKEVASADFKHQLSNNTINLIKAYAINLYGNATDGSPSVFGCENKANTTFFDGFHFLFKAMAKLQNIILTILGLLLSVGTLWQWKKQNVFFKICAIVVLYVIFISGISSDQGDRFHLVVYPIILLLLVQFYPKKFSYD